MKKLAKLTVVIILLSLMATSIVLAKPGVGNLEGLIKDPYPASTDPNSIIIETAEDGDILVNLPEDYDFDAFVVGDEVTVKGEWQGEYLINAEWVKLSLDVEETEEPEVEDPDKDDPEGDGNAWGQAGVYCAEGGKEEPHPMALKIAEKYGLSDLSFIMDYVCNGGSFGGVMLALQMGGEDPGAMLADRQGGKGWGQIMKEAGLIGKDKDDSPPPGQLKKEEKTENGPPEGKGKPEGNGPPEDKGPKK